MQEYSKRIIHRPPRYYSAPQKRVMLARSSHRIKRSCDEENIVAHIIANLRIAARWYSALTPNLYLESGLKSGLMVTMSVPSKDIVPDMAFPGDIDILAIPYDENDLILSETIVIEIKILRGERSRPGKSPNKYGYSQAESLFDHGFPNVGVGHLVVVDDPLNNPDRNMIIASVEKNNLISSYRPQKVDMLENDIALRALGRLAKNRKNSQIGYFVLNYDGGRIFEPFGQSCGHNPNCNKKLLDQIGDFYERNCHVFSELPRYSSSDIELWESRIKKNPDTKTPWNFYRDLFAGQRIISSEAWMIEVDGQPQIGRQYYTENQTYLIYGS